MQEKYGFHGFAVEWVDYQLVRFWSVKVKAPQTNMVYKLEFWSEIYQMNQFIKNQKISKIQILQLFYIFMIFVLPMLWWMTVQNDLKAPWSIANSSTSKSFLKVKPFQFSWMNLVHWKYEILNKIFEIIHDKLWMILEIEQTWFFQSNFKFRSENLYWF